MRTDIVRAPIAEAGAAQVGVRVRSATGVHEGLGASIVIQGLWKVYGSVVAVRDVTLAIRPGEFFTLLGPSGSGKTTTLQIIAGFVPPSRGDLAIDDRPVADLPPQKRGLGMVFQSYALFPHLSVFENIAFPLRVRRCPEAEIRTRVGAALALIRLDGLGGRLPGQLSGGQQQRVAVARALVFEPRALLMDEPLGALDKKLREQMQLELKHLQRQIGVTVVYVTHDQEEAMTMSDRVAVMRDGSVEQLGTPQEIYDTPRTRFVADFLGESNFLGGTVSGEDDDGWIVVETVTGGRLVGVSSSPLQRGDQVVAAIRPERIVVAEQGAGNASAVGTLEEVIYVGDSTRCRVRTSGHGVVTIKEQNCLSRTARMVSDRVTLRWRPTDVRVFPV